MVSRKSLLSGAKVAILGNEKMTSATAGSIVCEFERPAFSLYSNPFGVSVLIERGKHRHVCERTTTYL